MATGVQAGKEAAPAAPLASSTRWPPVDVGLRDLIRDVVREVVREELAAALNRTPPSNEASARAPTDRLQYLNTKQAAEASGVAEKTVRAWVRTGKLQGHWAGRLLRIERGELDRFMRVGLASTGEGPGVDKLAASILARPRKR
jgi:excisionase family DNA binding protein